MFHGSAIPKQYKIQCIIKASGLYYQPVKQAKINRKRSRSAIAELKRKPISGFLLYLGTIKRYVQDQKRYLTAMDQHIKGAFARMSTTRTALGLPPTSRHPQRSITVRTVRDAS